MDKNPESRRRTSRAWFIVGLSLLPLTLALQELAFRFSDITESIYGRWIYPKVAFLLGRMNALVPIPLAELFLALCAVFTFFWVVKWIKGFRREDTTFGRHVLKALTALWIVCGVVGFLFLVLWGFNYARPPLVERLGLFPETIEAKEVLSVGQLSAEMAASLHSALDVPSDHPTVIPIEFGVLNDVIDHRFRELSLPEDTIQYQTSPAKRLVTSHVLSYMGVSGIFIPFTGEPLMNGLLPDVTIPLIVAHEKAHQRGITNEGEANLAAFLVCAGSAEPYLRYSAYLHSAAQLIGSASVYLPEEARSAWELLEPGPRKDLNALREFWARYEGRLSKMAQRVNDTYLRSQRVPDGVESYGQVTQLLVALHRQGKFVQQ